MNKRMQFLVLRVKFNSCRAGSGKTRVLTTRLIHIINKKKLGQIRFCVTFTNKAAKEMQSRVMQYLKGTSNAIPWLGTFHSISVKFLEKTC